MASAVARLRSRRGRAGPGQPGGPDARPARAGRRPWWIWTVPFAAVYGVLLACNRFLFTARLYESGDSGANSILIEQAMRWQLLAGNYSREGFHHPGPAYLYVQALGEWLGRDVLHVVPTAWNGQLLAVLALDSAFAAITVGVVYGWTRSVRGAAACLAVIAGFAAVHPEILDSSWMPDLYVLTFLVFTLAAASVAARSAADLWVLALSGWFLIHGHACFLFIVPVITAAVLAVAAWPDRRSLRMAIRAFARDHRGAWLPALVISVMFALPIGVSLALHWPGDFGRYLAYGSSARAGGHSPGQVEAYALWFWWPHRAAWAAPLLLYAAAAAVTAALARGPLRRFLGALLAISVVASLAFAGYAAVGVDFLSDYYIGYFYWSVPVLLVLVIVVGLVQAVAAPRWTPAVVLAAVAALAAVAFVPGLRMSVSDNDRGLPRAVAALAARHPGRPIVIHIAYNAAWGDAVGFLVQAERTGVRACVDQPSYKFIVTSQFICNAGELAAGVRYEFVDPAPPPGTPVVLRFASTTVTPAVGLYS
ncbi:MAG: hypothetical protein ACLP7J_08510 [Streptosporangiaceae bacterium]